MTFHAPAAGERPTAAQWGDWVFRRTIAACTSSTRPASPVDGQPIYETDTDCLRIWNGSTWTLVERMGEQSYTPTWTNVTTPTATNSGRWWENAAGVFVQVTAVWTTAVTPSATPVTFSLPKTAAYTSFNVIGGGTWRDNGGTYASGGVILPASTTAALFVQSSFAYIPNTGHSVKELYAAFQFTPS